MLPENEASSIAVPGEYMPGDGFSVNPLADYELGGVGLNDASQGLQVRLWRLDYVDNLNVVVQPDVGGSPTTLFSVSGISELALAFDQNMRPFVAYKLGTSIFLRWYDTTVPGFVTTNFGVAKYPRLSLDDKRASQIGNSDVIFAYIRDNGLYYRQQRDRFTIERLLRDGLDPTLKLRAIGMSRNLRMQFELV